MNESVRISTNGGTLTLSAPLGIGDAEKAARTEQMRMNSGRRMPTISPLQARASDENKVYIYNVGPFQIPRYMGSNGVYTIPPCPEGKAHSEPLVIPGLVTELVINNEHSMRVQSDDGDYFADQVLGIGVGMKPKESPVHLGAFRSTLNPPGKEEVAEANRLFRDHCQRKVNEMNDAFAIGPEKVKEIKTPEHVMMARLLGLTETDCPWLKGSAAPANRETCGGCGKPYVVGIERCECGRVLDRPAFIKSVEEGMYPGITLESMGIKKPVHAPLKQN
jgi:hypothetical protein